MPEGSKFVPFLPMIKESKSMPKSGILALILGLALLAAVITGCVGKSVTTDTIPPQISISFPANNANLSGDTVLVTLTTFDNKGVAHVDFYVDGLLSYADSSAPFNYPWLILVYDDNTVHTLVATAYDAAGNNTSDSISVTVQVASGFHFISSAATSGVAYYNLFLSGNYAFLAEQGDGIEIFDISNPANPRLVSFYATGGGLANGVFVSGNYLFIAYGDQGLHLLDVTNPAAPVFRSSLILAGSPDIENVFVLGNYAYLAAKNSGMYIVDISNPDTLVQLGQYNTGSGIAYDLVVIDTLAYIAYGGAGMEIVNVKLPLLPVQVGNFTPAGSGVVRRLDIVGNRAYLALQNSGLEIVNITNPASPVSLGMYNPGFFLTGVDVDGLLAYLAKRDDGVEIVNVSNPASPSSVNFYNTEGQANNLIFRNSFVYIADQTSLTVLRYVP